MKQQINSLQKTLLSSFLFTLALCFSVFPTQNAQAQCDPSLVILNLADLGGGVVQADLGLPAGASLIDWTVDFGDGTPPNTYVTYPITHTYTNSGVYGVCAWGSYIINNMECFFQICNEIDIMITDPCDPSLVALNLTDLGGNVVEADLGLPFGAVIVNWTIDFGDGNPANTYASSPVNYTYAASGGYGVCAWGSYVINNMECFFQICNEIFIEDTAPCDPSLVSLNLTDLGSGVVEADLGLPIGTSIVNWTVDFGDATPPNTYLTSPVTHTYTNSGLYTVCAWGVYTDATGMMCDFQICNEIDIMITNPCDPSLVSLNLTDLGSGVVEADLGLPAGAVIVNWTIDFGDGNPANTYASSPVNYTYAASGGYGVCAWGSYVINNMECFFQICNEIFIEDTEPCDPSLVALNLTDLGGGVVEADLGLPIGTSIVNWTVDFGDATPPNTYLTTPVTHTYTNSGLYTVCAWGVYTDATGMMCDFQICNEIEIIIQTEPCDPSLVSLNLTDLGSGVVEADLGLPVGASVGSWTIDFGDGNPANTYLTSPVNYTYATSGLYVVCAWGYYVDAAGMECDFQICNEIEIIIQTEPCDPSLVALNLTDLGGNVVEADLGLPAGASVVSWTIDFGDGNPANTYASSPVNYTYTNGGTYVVCAWGYYIINNMECDFQICNEVTIIDNSNPCDDINLGLNLFANGLELGVSPLFDTSIVSAWEVDFGDGYTTGVNTGLPYSPVHTYSAGGFYTVCLYVWIIDPFTGMEILCEICEEIYIDPCTSNPPLDFDIWVSGTNVDVCPIITTTAPMGVISWNWDFGDGIVVSDISPSCQTYTYNGAGMYVICLTVLYEMNDGTVMECVVCKEVFIEDWCINTGVILEYQQNAHVGFLPTIIPDFHYEFTWDFGDGTTYTTDQIGIAEHTYTASGTYTVCLMIVMMDITGNVVAICYHYLTVEVTDPCFGFNVELESSIVSCTNNDGVLAASVVGGTAPYTYTWTNDQTNQTSVAGPQIGNLAAGSYTVVVTDANGCTTTATMILVQEDCECVAIAPTGLTTTINWPQVTLAWNPVPNVAQYQLAGRKLGGAVKIFPPQTTTFRTFNSGISPNSTYQWAVRSICPDGSVSDWSVIETFTTPNAKNASQSIADPFETNETALTAKAYPNPAINNVTIEYTLGENTWSSNENVNITISDLLGRTVISQTVENSQTNTLNVDVSQLPTGTYILQIDNGFDKHTEKLSVAH